MDYRSRANDKKIKTTSQILLLLLLLILLLLLLLVLLCMRQIRNDRQGNKATNL